MAAKILYTKKGSDPNTIVWPDSGPPDQRWSFTSGTPKVIMELLGWSNSGVITFPSNRVFPMKTAQGLTFTHVN
jgi:hypothetical protein